MSQVNITRTYSTGGSLPASNYNDDRTEIVAGVNSIDNTQISSSAGIEASKIANTAVTLSDVQTVTNKTFTSPVINTPTINTPTINPGGTITKPTLNGSVQALASQADGATVTFDLSAANVQSVTLAGNRTLALSNISTGQAFILNLVQDGTGTRTVTWFSGIKWPGGSVPTLTTTAGRIDSLGFLCIGSGTYLGYILGQNMI